LERAGRLHSQCERIALFVVMFADGSLDRCRTCDQYLDRVYLTCELYLLGYIENIEIDRDDGKDVSCGIVEHRKREQFFCKLGRHQSERAARHYSSCKL